MSMNSYIPQITRNLRSTMPTIVTKPYGQHVVNPQLIQQQAQMQLQQIPLQSYYPQQVLFVPYGTPFMYTGVPVQTYYQPVTYPSFQPTQFVMNTNAAYEGQNFIGRKNNYTPKNKNRNQESEFSPVDFGYTSNGYYDETQGLEDEEDRSNLTIYMDVVELNRNIRHQLETNQTCRVSWLNRMISKSNTTIDFEQALELYKMYQEKNLEVTPETATLLIKAACRAEIPERALELMQNTEQITISPTLGGIHYLMINFSLKKDTKSVMMAYDVIKKRNMKATARTFHILIRECVDNDLVNEAMKFHLESKNLDILPNRVTCNILMNGLRKFNKGEQLLELRKQMNENNIDINDTTIKFTVLAYMMLNKPKEAIEEFLNYQKLDIDLEKFCTKFFETSEESEEQMKLAINLFERLQKKITLPASILKKLEPSQ